MLTPESSNTFAQVRAFLDRSLQAEREEREAKRRARRQQLYILAFVVTVVTSLAFFSSAQWHNAEQQKQHAEAQRVAAEQERQTAADERDKALRTQSLFLSDLSRQQLEKGDAVTAMLLALEALPKDLDKPERPYVREAEQALYDAALQQRERVVLRGHGGAVNQAVFSPDGRGVNQSAANSLN